MVKKCTILLLLFCAGNAVAEFPTFVRVPAIKRGETRALREASGLAPSLRSPGSYWSLNDSGNKPALYLLDPAWKETAAVSVGGVKNRDWEAIASFPENGHACLLIADTGDNGATRDTSQIYIVTEPHAADAECEVLRVISFRFEDGPRDCESVAVDAVSHTALLLSKRTNPPALYSLSLAAAKHPVIARRIGTTRVDAPTGSIIPFANQPVDLAIAQDSSFAAVLTYYGVFLFPKKSGETWAAAFAKAPVALGPHGLPQAEGIAISANGRSITVISEGNPAGIARFEARR